MKIYVVGIGPGGTEQMTAAACKAIEKSEVIVGYSKYIELIESLIKGKEVYTSVMKQEKQRCKKALEYCIQGKNVSVISSGDAGVYGMAGLMYEISENNPEIDIEVIPGITAAVSAAAVLGAPLMHDFSIISLSDLLTPWDKIEKRIKASAEVDFIICLYNPGSKKRSDYLKIACSYMLEYKSPDTKCGWVRNIGRSGEESGICTLKELTDFKADMFTTVIIGNSSTKVINNKLVTPRGYEL